MLISAIPTKMPVKWGASAPGPDIRSIPIPSQTGVQAGAASFTDGFPAVCFTPVSGGGTPPFGQDFNGIFNVLTAWLQWVQAGGQFQFDATFSSGGAGTNIGGYPAGAVVASAAYPFGRSWQSIIDNNTVNPDTTPASWAGWQTYPLPGSIFASMLSPSAVPRPYVPAQTADNLILANDTASFNGTITGNTTLTVNSIASGFLSVGSVISGAGVTAGTTITAFGSGSGGTGTYTITSSTNVGAEAMTATTNNVNVNAGRVPDQADTTWLPLAAQISKRLDVSWVSGGTVGAPQGGLDTGSALAANATYHVYVIGKVGMSITSRARTSNVATIGVTGHGLGVGGTVRVAGVGFGYDGVWQITAVAANTINYNNTGTAETTQTVALAVADGFDVLLSQQSVNSYPSPGLPSGWTLSQCLGSVVTDANKAMRPFTQVGDEFLFVTGIALTLSGSTTASLVSLPTPNGVKTMARLRVQASTGSAGNYLFTSPDEADQTPTNSVSTLAPSSASASDSCGCETTTRTNTAAQIRQRAAGSIAANGSCYGWRDPRRRLF